MKITFEDGSFLELEHNNDGSVRLVLCGIKGYNQTTMSAADLNKEQVVEITNFFLNQSSEIST